MEFYKLFIISGKNISSPRKFLVKFRRSFPVCILYERDRNNRHIETFDYFHNVHERLSLIKFVKFFIYGCMFFNGWFLPLFYVCIFN